MSIIEIENLSKHFYVSKSTSFFKKEKKKITAVDNISFSIEKGERIGFIGPNGAGKSTTIKMLTGAMTPTFGAISVMGHTPFKREDNFLKKIGVLFGNTSSLWKDLTVEKNFSLLKVIFDIEEKQFKKTLKKLVETFSLEKLLNRPVKTLSLGQRMKCEIVACLLHNPEVLFLDEPSIGLDLNSKAIIRDLILDYSKKNNITVILTSHDIFDIEEICDRIIIIDQGKIIVDDSINSIKDKYISHKNITVLSEYASFQWNHPNTRIISQKPYETIIQVATDDISLKEVIFKLLETTSIKDLNINHPSLESIIKGIYSKDLVCA